MKNEDYETKNEGKINTLKTDVPMMKKILVRECGDCETDEFAADEIEIGSNLLQDEECDGCEDSEFAEDTEIGESKYFSTCKFTMISDEDDLVDFQGS